MNRKDVFIGTLDELANKLFSEYIGNSSFQGRQLNYSPSQDAKVPAVGINEFISTEKNGKTFTLRVLNAAEIPMPWISPDEKYFDASYANGFKGKTFYKGQVYQLTLFGVYYDKSSNLIAFYPALPGDWAAWEEYWHGQVQEDDLAVWAVVNHLEGETLTGGAGSLTLWDIDGALAEKQDKPLYFTDVTVAEWDADATYDDYAYRASVALEGVAADMVPHVYFSGADALSGNYAPICTAYDGGVYIYGKTDAGVAIPLITLEVPS